MNRRTALRHMGMGALYPLFYGSVAKSQSSNVVKGKLKDDDFSPSFSSLSLPELTTEDLLKMTWVSPLVKDEFGGHPYICFSYRGQICNNTCFTLLDLHYTCGGGDPEPVQHPDLVRRCNIEENWIEYWRMKPDLLPDHSSDWYLDLNRWFSSGLSFLDMVEDEGTGTPKVYRRSGDVFALVVGRSNPIWPALLSLPTGERS